MSETDVDFTPIPADIYCPQCGYNLFATTAARCSECGYSLAGLRANESTIPWMHRHANRLVAFWKTVWFVTIRHRQFCEEQVRTVGYKDARLFQWVVVLHVWLPMAAVVVWLNYEAAYNFTWNPWSPFPLFPFAFASPSWWQLACIDIWPAALMLACLLLFLLAASGVSSYFFHPRTLTPERQDTAIAMSYYACAPLVFTCIPVLAIPIAILVTTRNADAISRIVSIDEHTTLVWATALVTPAVITWITITRTARRTMPQLPRRVWSLTFSLPLLWLNLGGLILVALPAAIVYVLVVFTSFS